MCKTLQDKKETEKRLDEVVRILRKKINGEDSMHLAVNKLDDADLLKTIKETETYLLEQRKLGLASHAFARKVKAGCAVGLAVGCCFAGYGADYVPGLLPVNFMMALQMRAATGCCVGAATGLGTYAAVGPSPKTFVDNFSHRGFYEGDEKDWQTMQGTNMPSQVCDVSKSKITAKRDIDVKKEVESRSCCYMGGVSCCFCCGRKNEEEFIKLTIQGPPVTKCGFTLPSCFQPCFRQKKILRFPMSQESTLDRIFTYDMEQSQPYFYDEVTLGPRKEFYPCDKRVSTSAAPKQQTMQ